MAARPEEVIFTITPSSPAGPGVRLLHDEAPPRMERDVNWRVTDRPRRIGATEFEGMSPYTLSLPAVLSYADVGRSIETLFSQIESNLAAIRPPKNEPPVLRVSGASIPPDARSLQWVFTKLEPGEEERNDDGTRSMARFVVVLLQYVPPAIITKGGASPAKAAVQRAVSGTNSPTTSTTPADDDAQINKALGIKSGTTVTTTTSKKEGAAATKEAARKSAAAKKNAQKPGPAKGVYLTKQGDTLITIATRLLGSQRRFPELIDLNPKYYDPNLEFRAGVELKMPSDYRPPRPAPTLYFTNTAPNSRTPVAHP